RVRITFPYKRFLPGLINSTEWALVQVREPGIFLDSITAGKGSEAANIAPPNTVPCPFLKYHRTGSLKCASKKSSENRTLMPKNRNAGYSPIKIPNVL